MWGDGAPDENRAAVLDDGAPDENRAAVLGDGAPDENRAAVLGDVFSLLFDLMTTEGVTKDSKVCYCGLSLAPL